MKFKSLMHEKIFLLSLFFCGVFLFSQTMISANNHTASLSSLIFKGSVNAIVSKVAATYFGAGFIDVRTTTQNYLAHIL